jgi:D-alanyl-D-alanine carboxypeptidase
MRYRHPVRAPLAALQLLWAPMAFVRAPLAAVQLPWAPMASVLATVLQLLWTPMAFAQALAPTALAPTALVHSIDEIVGEALEAGPIAGVSVAVQRGPELVLARGYGYADLENGVRATAETVFRIGSVTKQFTAAAVLQLAEQGQLRLEDPITRFFPDYPTGGRTVTVHHLLNMTSGITNYTAIADSWRALMRVDVTHDELIGSFADRPLDFEPGERYRYSNSGYYMAGVIVEQLSGMTFREYLDRHVFAAAGLTATYYCDDEPLIPNRARGYTARDGRLVNASFIAMNTPGGAGALCSTALDMVKWARALAAGQVTTAASYEQMRTPRPAALPNGDAHRYGYGLMVGELAGRTQVAHGGGINGFNAQLSHYPDEDLIIAVLTNTGGASAIARRIAQLMLDVPAATSAR